MRREDQAVVSITSQTVFENFENNVHTKQMFINYAAQTGISKV